MRLCMVASFGTIVYMQLESAGTFSPKRWIDDRQYTASTAVIVWPVVPSRPDAENVCLGIRLVYTATATYSVYISI